MDILILAFYGFLVWLIFIKFKWLPWNITSQVIVAIIPIVGMTILLLTLNVVAPSSSQLRAYRYQVPIVSQVAGRVIEVGVEEGNRPVKQGDMLFRVDPTPFENSLRVLRAQLASAEGDTKKLNEQLRESVTNTAAVRSKLDLARKRVTQYRDLVASGAGNRFDLEAAQADVASYEAQLAGSVAAQSQIKATLGAVVDGDISTIAKIKADIIQAQWMLDQSVTRSPCDCIVVNMQLRRGAYVTAMPFNNVMTLIEQRGQIVALYRQNELHQVAPGDEAEFVLPTRPGEIFKGTVDSVIWAQGLAQARTDAQGFMAPAAVLTAPPAGFAVKFNFQDPAIAEEIGAGASGDVAIYTQTAKAIHIIRKVILRVGSYTNYIVPKLH
jgi:multidrug resistance efflux pump